jgi:GH25 family lysozyme M1 (1,4-beta-N-acetylmuramidase)
MNGIDVSKYQEDIDFNKVKAAGNQFVILRAGRGRGTSYEKDVWFERNYDKAKAAGLHIGAYWYSDTSTIEGAVKEANTCLSILDGRKLDMPLYFDVEEKHQLEKGTKFVDSIIVAFNDVIKKAGYYPGLYMSEYYLTNIASKDVREKYEIWVARYAKSYSYTGNVGMWQYTDKGYVDGVKWNVDMNKCYVDYPTIIKKSKKLVFIKFILALWPFSK